MESTSSLNGRIAGAITSRCATDATPRSGTRWNEETSDGFDAFLARNGWRHYFLRDDLRVLDLCPDCAARALRLGEIRTLADCWIRPVRSYTHADQEVSAQLSARERMTANLLLTAA